MTNFHSSHPSLSIPFSFLSPPSGVGKGRQVAALFLENWMQGRKKGIWMSASKDLQHDARRDLNDIDAEDIPSEALSDMSYGKIQLKEGTSLVLSLSSNILSHTISEQVIITSSQQSLPPSLS